MIQMVPNSQAVSDSDTDSLWKTRESTDAFLNALRGRGAFEIECIKAIRRLKGCSLGEAKEIVHFSRTFSDRRGMNDRLHEDGWQALEEFALDDAAEQKLAS